MKKTTAAGILAASMLLTTLAGCGSSSLTQTSSAAPAASTPTTASVNADLAAKVPAKIKSAGVIQIGTDATYRPNEYMNGTDVVGMDVDLFNAVAADLGLKTKWNPADFDSLLLGVAAGKYDIGISSFTINAKRLGQVTMIQYANVGTQWAVPKGNPKNIDKSNVCGKSIAYQLGTVQDDEMQAAQAKCGANKINLLGYKGQDEVNNALASGKADAMLADYPVTQDAIKVTGKLDALGDQYGTAPYGYAVTKENTDFANAISGALSDLKKSGKYDEILAKYGISAAAVTSFPVNPTVS